MKPVYQTDLSSETGNCLAASIASLYDIDIHDVPFFGEDGWEFKMSKWAIKALGKIVVTARFNDHYPTDFLKDSYVIVTINTPGPAKRHAVIAKNGRIVFCPSQGSVDWEITKDMDPVYVIFGDYHT